MNDLSELMRDRLDALDVPPPDLALVHRRGHRIRGLRAVAGASALVVAVVAVGLVIDQTGGGGADDGGRGIDPIGHLDLDQGLRAYAAPGAEIHLGGRSFPAADIEYLDTDAAATPYGVLFYDRGRPMLLDESGDVVELEPGADKGGFHPTAKADSQAPLVAYGVTRDGESEVVVRDLAADEVVATHAVPGGTVIDGIDGGVVFLRGGGGTTTWDSATDREQELAGPQTSVADVRNGVILYDGPTPRGPSAAAYRLVKGAIDAQLTFDGGHVLYWSSTLESTNGGDPVVLDAGATRPGPTTGWWAVDTDGSILTAVPGPGNSNTVYDCEVPSGACTELGPLTTEHGDPEFIGVDM